MKSKKQFLVFAIMLLMGLLLPTMALAADQTMGVQLNGENVKFTDAVPVMEKDRVYVPFRAVFEALDASVVYDAATSQITAEKGDTKVVFTVGDSTITVNDKTVATDAASFVRNGRTYVPVRFAAQSLGAAVGWDSTSRTVVMVDKTAIAADLKDQYTVMDKLLTYNKAFNKEPLAVKGTLTFTMKVAGDNSTMIPISGNMTVEGLSTSDQSNVAMATTLRLDELKAALQKAGALGEEDNKVLEQLQKFNIQVIVNMQTGKLYMKSELFGLTGMRADAWYQMDLNQVLQNSGMNLNELLTSSNAATTEESIRAMLNTLPMTDANSTATILQMVEQMKDKHLSRSGNDYTMTLRTEEVGGVKTVVQMEIQTNGKEVTGYSMDMKLYTGTTPMMTVKAAQTNQKVTMTMDMQIENVVTMNLSGDLNYTATTEKPQGAPAAGETVVDLMNLLGLVAA